MSMQPAPTATGFGNGTVVALILTAGQALILGVCRPMAVIFIRPTVAIENFINIHRQVLLLEEVPGLQAIMPGPWILR